MTNRTVWQPNQVVTSPTWYQYLLSKCDDSNGAYFRQKLAEVQRLEGETLFDWLVEMIESYPEIELRLQ